MARFSALFDWASKNGSVSEKRTPLHTHTDISSRCTQLLLKRDVAEEKLFVTHYCDDLKNGVSHFLSEIAEPENFRAFIDVDLKFDRNETVIASRCFPFDSCVLV